MQVVILAREAGLELELSDVPVASLVPAGLETGTPAEFLQKLDQFDGDIAEQSKAAAEKVPLLLFLVHLIHSILRTCSRTRNPILATLSHWAVCRDRSCAMWDPLTALTTLAALN